MFGFKLGAVQHALTKLLIGTATSRLPIGAATSRLPMSASSAPIVKTASSIARFVQLVGVCAAEMASEPRKGGQEPGLQSPCTVHHQCFGKGNELNALRNWNALQLQPAFTGLFT